MKVMLIAINLAFLCTSLNAQNSIEALFDKMAKKEDASRILINKNMLDMFSDEESLKEATQDVKAIEILVFEDQNQMDNKSYKQFLNSIKSFDLDEIMSVRSNGSYFDILYNEKKGFFENILLLAKSDDTTILLRLDGRIRVDKIGNLDIDIDGVEHLQKLGRA